MKRQFHPDPYFSRSIDHSRANFVRTAEPASQDLIRAIQQKGRTVSYALPESEELRYLDYMRSNANVGGPKMTDILLRSDATKVEVLEEFLHGTQFRLGIVNRLGVKGAEVHVKAFMVRHQRLLGISLEDVQILRQMLGGQDESAVSCV